ncbi:energy-coupled thiamine transporter ThiT [Lachnospiraceae bacterium]|nr:energy-coupled thiamine transporter ThiT [Lachnospiraceae bacterium]
MHYFFTSPANKWSDHTFQLTPAGILTVAAVIALLVIASLLRRCQKSHSRKLTTRQLVFSAAAMALALVASMIKLFEMPMGGSVTLLSMLFIVLIGYWYGPYAGLMTAAAYGLLQFVLEPVFYTIPQMITDYPLAFGALGLSGFFCKRKHGLITGYIIGVLGRFFFSFLSGVIFFASYAPDTMAAPIYALAYNGSYLGAEAAVTLSILVLPPVSKAMAQVKQMALEE